MLSVVISTFNHAQYLPKLLECCASASDYVSEVILCDDCSTDSTPEVVESWREKLPILVSSRNDSNTGIARTVNFVVSQVSNADFLFIPSDDYFDPDMMRLLLDFKRGNDLDIAYGKYQIAEGTTTLSFQHRGWEHRSYAGGRDEFVGLLANDMYMFPGATLFSTHLFEKRPYYDVGLDDQIRDGRLFGQKTFGAQDLKLVLDLARDQQANFGFLNEYVSVFTRLQNQLSGDRNYNLTGRAAVEYAYLICESVTEKTHQRLRPVLFDMYSLLSHKCEAYEHHLAMQQGTRSILYTMQTDAAFARLAKYL